MLLSWVEKEDGTQI